MMEVIIHHSLTKDGKVKDYDSIEKYHIEIMKMRKIGYQYILEQIYNRMYTLKGRRDNEDGAHTYGKNKGTIGICCVGNFDKASPDQDVMDQLYNLLDDLKQTYGQLKISGHCDYPHPITGHRKTCPGKMFPLQEVKDRYAQHWVDPDVKYLKENGMTINEKRYDEKIKRCEVISLIARLMRSVKS